MHRFLRKQTFEICTKVFIVIIFGQSVKRKKKKKDWKLFWWYLYSVNRGKTIILFIVPTTEDIACVEFLILRCKLNSVHLRMHSSSLSTTDRTWHKANLSCVASIRFVLEFRVFLLLDWFRGSGKNRGIHAFFKGISAKWNKNHLIQNFNSVHKVHFPRR